MYLGYGILRLFYGSYRYLHLNEQARDRAERIHPKGAYILALWHEYVIYVVFSQKGRPFRPIASRSGGGRFIGFVCEKFGYKVIYGSQDRAGRDKGGKAALFALFRELNKGFPAAITVDGSVGPRRKTKQGIIELARKTGAPIVPISAHASRCWEFPTWDRLKLPQPFARLSLYYGDPIVIPSNLNVDDIATYQDQIDNAIDLCETNAKIAMQRHSEGFSH
jgi:lysophospholipid acyltransferase (LPLAT)-like uncharacterized protein